MSLILSCSNSLGNCCKDSGLLSILGVFSNIIEIVQIVVPIILLLMVCIKLLQMVINPDEKKNFKTLRNQIIAAVIVFFIPMLINVLVGMIDNTNINFVSCLKESKNIKLSNNVTYISDSKKKPSKVINDYEYEKGDPKKTDDDGGTVTGGSSITPGEAIIGDPNVKVRKNIYNKKASIVRKLNGQEVVDYAKTWIGKLHYDHGTTAELRPGGSCDCSQFIYRVLKHFDAVESEAPSIYCSMWSSGNVKGTILYSDLSHLVPGDVVADYWSDYSQHVEIYAGGNNTVGCDGNGVSIGHRANQYKTFIHLTAYD